jgi:metacaspase-1
MKARIYLCVVVMLGMLMVVDWHPARAERKALIVGVEEYSSPEFNLKGVKEDVKLFRDLLIKKGLFSNGEIKTLLDEEASRANILKAFQEWLIEGTRPGDRALFYFSGHGIQIWNENGVQVQDGMDRALMCWDAKVTRNRVSRTFRGRPGLAFTADGTQNFIIGQEIGALLKQMKGRTVVVMSDSCHAGSIHKRANPFFVQYKTIIDPVAFKSVFEPRRPDADRESMVKENTNMLSGLDLQGPKLAVLTACEASQPAEIVRFDKEPKGMHSVFTWYLLHALEGKADANQQGKITFGALAKYLQEEVRRDGYAQIPQYDFQPKSVADEVLIGTDVRTAPDRLERPGALTCSLKTDKNVSAAQRESALASLRKSSIPLSLTGDQTSSACAIDLQKSSGTYGARLSDSTGTYWETHRGPDLNTALDGVLKNLRAYWVQTNAAALRNSAAKLVVDLDYEVKAPSERKAGQVVKGDRVVFRAKPKTTGYLYLFSVDSTGVIHPLYPAASAEAKKSNPGEDVVVGQDGLTISVQAPFGKDVVFAFLTSRPLDSLKSYWARDDIGDAVGAGVADQAQFLDVLWKELAASGAPRGEWTSRLWSLESFESAE